MRPTILAMVSMLIVACGGSDESGRVRGGTFTMGCTDPPPFVCPADELPTHVVTISPFVLDVTGVTQAEYKACVDAGACTPPSAQFDPAGHGDYPVSFVSW